MSKKQSGFSLVELLVAVTIGLFIVGGLGAVYVHLKQAFNSQGQLAQLQDSERLALTMLTTTIEESGYFPDPLNYTAATEPSFVAASIGAGGVYGSVSAGQGLVGTSGSSGASDTLTTRFVTAPASGLLNCLGKTNTGTANALFTNTFTVDANGLSCSTDGGLTSTPLAGQVVSLSASYLVDTTGLGTALGYRSAAAVTAAGLWSNVRSVQLTVVFTNPLAAQAGQPATTTWVQNVSVLNHL
ncbi:MAG: PilW family protein [Burkholderiales bacterium]|nr:PilW family protein [Burkholderiales bacterium]MDE2394707.1 PilW family protein [Burkholderiales bacterium]MDE2452650.1 PilW family protein [Burkholderiales bacterium]